MTEIYKAKKVKAGIRLEDKSFDEAISWKLRTVTYSYVQCG